MIYRKTIEEAAAPQEKNIHTGGSGPGVSERISAADNGTEIQKYMDAGHYGTNIQEPVPTIVESSDAYPDLLKSSEPKKPQGTGRRNSFHNFNERDYDYDKLEKWLLNTSLS